LYKKYKDLKDKMNVSDYEVAKATQITKSTFSDWKTGRSNPKIDKLQKIAAYFGVSLEYFLEE
jgi:Predicted transcriptional regulators